MPSPVDSAILAKPKKVDGLDISPAEDGYIVYEPDLDRVHFLNPVAILILELCNGSNTEGKIVDLIGDAFGPQENLAEAIGETLAKMKAEGLLT
jgi:hypothetical protein